MMLEHWTNDMLRGAPAAFQRAAREYAEEYAAAAVAAERERGAADARLGAFLRRTGSIEEQATGWQVDCFIAGAPSLETLDDVLRA
jgi:hypothetical protein